MTARTAASHFSKFAPLKTKLTALNPRWTLGTHWATPDGVAHSCGPGDTQGRFGMGLSFDCPIHMAFNSPHDKRHRIKIFFANPLDGLPPENGVSLWQRGGGSFKALTVSPTGDARTECWHGFITNGMID